MHRFFASSLRRRVDAGFHTSASRAAITKFTLPALSPTMTEGSIHKWMKKEGESFAAGDVLLELETDKAQMDVEAQDDGVLAKIILTEGKKAAVNTTIALLAEEGDDISNVEFKEEQEKSSSQAPSSEIKTTSASVPATSAPPAVSGEHHEIDTSKIKKSLSPAVLNLVLKYGIKDLEQIKASGPGGRILKGDVLAHLGQIKYKPAPKQTTSAAPPRDQIVFAKPTNEIGKKTKEKEEALPTFISKQVTVDHLLNHRQALNAEHKTNTSVNDWIAKAAARALQDVVSPVSCTPKSTGILSQLEVTPATFTESYKGGSFKVFNLANPNYDFITDSYEPSKPYVLEVSESRHTNTTQTKHSSDDAMLNLIGYLGGEISPRTSAHSIRLTSEDVRLNFSKQPRKNSYSVQLKLEGGAPGKILNDPKSSVFLDRVEHYIKNPEELVA